MRKTSAFLAAVSLAMLATPAQSATIIDTGPAGALNGGGYTLDASQGLAARFSTASAFTITSAEGWIGSQAGSIFNVGIYLADLVNGTPTGPAIFSSNFVSGPDGWQGVFGQSWTLASGDYFLGFTSTSGSGYMPSGAPAPATGYAGFHPGAQGWYNAGPLNFGVRAFGSPAVAEAAVPEPSTWALMLVGFGAIGATMRRKKRQTVRVSYA